MSDLNIAKTTVLERDIDDYSVDPAALDAATTDESTWDFKDASQNLGYYKTIPELKKAVDALAMWTTGKGYKCALPDSEAILDHISGWGKDCFATVMFGMVVMKKVIGDAFAEIVRDDKSGKIINLKPISPERMRIVTNKKGIIKRYEYKNNDKTPPTKFKPEQIFHLTNDRIADEIHGTSVIDACKWVIDARNEAMTDYRKVLHRNVIPVRIIEVDTEDVTKRNAFMTEYKDAIQKGEVLVIPKGTVEFKEDQITIQDPSTWIQYLENFFYQAVGIPKIILGGSEQFTEATSKVGYLTFEQVYMTEQSNLEYEIWNQLAIDLQFERPVSLKDSIQSSEAKNTGQVGMQPNDMANSMYKQ